MWPKTLLSTVTVLFLVCQKIRGESHNVMLQEKHILDTLFNSSTYDRRIRPVENNDVSSPTKVTVNMFVRMLNKVDDIKMQYSAQVTLRQYWLDPRLKYNNMDGAGKFPYINLFDERVWAPDLFISNEKSGYINNLMKPNQFYRIYPDGQVLFSARLSLVLSCPMDLKAFPFDTQICSIRFASYGYTSNGVIFVWKEYDPVQIVRNLNVAHFSLRKFMTEECSSTTNTGSYSCLSVKFELKRNINHCLVHIFIPSMMLVMISWISFWLDHQLLMTRLFAVLTTLLVLSYRLADFNATLSPVTYTRAIDIWTGTCMTFVFSALIEVVIVDYKWRQQQKKQRRATGILDNGEEENAVAIDMKPLVSNASGNAMENRNHAHHMGRLRNFFYRLKSSLPTGPKKFDVVCRYLFPLAFGLFNVFYWMVNLL